MADESAPAPAERKPRKSVAFSDGLSVVDNNGEVTETNGAEDKNTAQGHSGGKSYANSSTRVTNDGTLIAHLVGNVLMAGFTDKAEEHDVDEVTDMFKDLAKKKKKSKKPKEGEENDGEEVPAADGEFDPSALKKKKKKKVVKAADADDFEAKLAEAGANQNDGEEPAEKEVVEVDNGDPLKGTGIWAHDETANITYPLLLNRFFTLLHSQHPDLASSGSKSYKIPPPQCLREGNKKTIFANIAEISKRMKRTDEHVTQFLFAELGTSGSVDGSRRLVIKGRFQQKQIENVLRRYIVEYVTCRTCRSPDTELNKGENRLYFVTCNSCGSRRSVTAIKTGFSAQVGKRRRQQG
ncbi:domain found in IF2B/IF5-domain-containing protein [Cryomyces antarcticus]